MPRHGFLHFTGLSNKAVLGHDGSCVKLDTRRGLVSFSLSSALIPAEAMRAASGVRRGKDSSPL